MTGDNLARSVKGNSTQKTRSLFQRGKNTSVFLSMLNSAKFKRLFDIGFSLGVLIFGAPVYFILASCIAVTSPGPIFYVQQRVGKHYKPFRCLKFRTMVCNADEVLAELFARYPELQQEFAETYKLKQDPRITKIGKFLRLTSLDELPQFWNVLKGDMSVVGPRPLVPDELRYYGRYMTKVLTVKPGITGLWQVSGRNDLPYQRRIHLDVYYSGYHTLMLDLFIILKTVRIVLLPRNNGAY